jgi:hypothetical protein
MPLSVVFARKKLTIGCALQIGATTEAGACTNAFKVKIDPMA